METCLRASKLVIVSDGGGGYPPQLLRNHHHHYTTLCYTMLHYVFTHLGEQSEHTGVLMYSRCTGATLPRPRPQHLCHCHGHGQVHGQVHGHAYGHGHGDGHSHDHGHGHGHGQVHGHSHGHGYSHGQQSLFYSFGTGHSTRKGGRVQAARQVGFYGTQRGVQQGSTSTVAIGVLNSQNSSMLGQSMIVL